jgi:hypothetical protein
MAYGQGLEVRMSHTVWGSGCYSRGSKIQGSAYEGTGLGVTVLALGCRVSGVGCTVGGEGCRVKDVRCRV